MAGGEGLHRSPTGRPQFVSGILPAALPGIWSACLPPTHFTSAGFDSLTRAFDDPLLNQHYDSTGRRCVMTRQSRPWYVSDRACDDYVSALGEGGDLQMLKALKILRSILVNVGIIAIGVYSIRVGADPTVIGLAALAVLGGYNGLEVSDYMALVRAYREVQQEDKSQS